MNQCPECFYTVLLGPRWWWIYVYTADLGGHPPPLDVDFSGGVLDDGDDIMFL